MDTPETPDHLPSAVDPHVGLFDRFAGGVARFTARAPFFAACVLLVFVWAPSLPLFGDVDTWQLVINTGTTIVTFLLVALLQNSAARSDKATQHKLNALAAGVATIMSDDRARHELLEAVGLEERESS